MADHTKLTGVNIPNISPEHKENEQLNKLLRDMERFREPRRIALDLMAGASFEKYLAYQKAGFTKQEAMQIICAEASAYITSNPKD